MNASLLYNTKQKWSKQVQLTCTCLFLLFSLSGNTQNLVPNGDFEDTLWCPEPVFGTQLEATGVWFDGNTGSCDFYHKCADETSGYTIFYGNSFFANSSGNGFAGFYNYADSINFSEYLEVKLLDSLQKDSSYILSADLKATAVYNASDAVDFVFKKDSANFPGFNYNPFPQVFNPWGHIISDSINWYTLKGSFVAQGGEQWLTIGNFRLWQNISWSYGSNPSEGQAYVLIDNIVVEKYKKPIPPVIEPPTPETPLPFNVYPNPNNGLFTITYTLDTLASHELRFYNTIGQIVYAINLDSNVYSTSVDLSHLANGLYVYCLYSEGRKTNRGKLLITK